MMLDTPITNSIASATQKFVTALMAMRPPQATKPAASTRGSASCGWGGVAGGRAARRRPPEIRPGAHGDEAAAGDEAGGEHEGQRELRLAEIAERERARHRAHP